MIYDDSLCLWVVVVFLFYFYWGGILLEMCAKNMPSVVFKKQNVFNIEQMSLIFLKRKLIEKLPVCHRTYDFYLTGLFPG